MNEVRSFFFNIRLCKAYSIFLCCLSINTFLYCNEKSNKNNKIPVSFDVTVIGPVCFADGIGRQAIGFIDCLKDVAHINFIHTRCASDMNLTDLPDDVKNIVQRKMQGKSNIAILEDVLSNGNPSAPEYYYKKVPRSSKIKFAYTMFESTKIPEEWVTILNENFDAALVPDDFLVEVYKNCGVTIPIFVLPLGIYIEKLLALPLKKTTGKPFTFGFSGAFTDRKNHVMALEGFAAAFKNSSDVRLRLHGRSGNQVCKKLRERSIELGLTNVEIICKSFNEDEYIDFMQSLDCYVSFSKGEGFAIPPREALALGIPSIIAENTAHKTICQTGFVKSVPSVKEMPAYYDHLQKTVGNNFNCDVADVAQAMYDVYNNYEEYKEKALLGRKWVTQYLYKNLQETYLNLIKPHEIVLGDHNCVNDRGIITNSKTLYKKYKNLAPVQPPFIQEMSEPEIARENDPQLVYESLNPVDANVSDIDIIGGYRIMTGTPIPFYDYVHFKKFTLHHRWSLTQLAHHFLAMIQVQEHLKYPSLSSIAEFPVPLRNGMTLFGFETDIFIAHSIKEYGYWEPEVETILRKVVKPGDCALDIGANIGYFTAILSECVGSSGAVYAIEGLPALCSLLEKSKIYNQWNNVTICNCLLGNSAQTVFFLVNAINPGGSSIISRAEAAVKMKIRPQAIMQVDTKTLDEVMSSYSSLTKIDFIKMDVEGAEYFVLQGAQALLKKFYPKIILEFSPRRYQDQGINPVVLLEELVQKGYHFESIENLKNVDDPLEYLRHNTRDPYEFMDHFEKNNSGHVDILFIPVL